MDKVHKLGLMERVQKLTCIMKTRRRKSRTAKSVAESQAYPNWTTQTRLAAKMPTNVLFCGGDSAKAMAIAGLSVVGRDHYGVFLFVER